MKDKEDEKEVGTTDQFGFEIEDDDHEDDQVEKEEETIVVKKHMRCFVHYLMCALRCTVDKDHDFIAFRKSIFSIVKKITKSTKLSERLKTLSDSKLVSASQTRWNSTYFVFERLLKLSKEIDIIAKENHWDPLPISTLKTYVDFLKPFADETDFLQGTNYPTLPGVINTLITLETHLNDKMKDEKVDTLAFVVKNEMKQRFDYIQDVNAANFDPTYVTAYFLDPTVALSLDDGQASAAKALIMQMSNDPESYVIQPPSQAPTSSHLPAAVLERIEKRRLNATISASSNLQAEISAYWNALEIGERISDCVKFWEKEKDHYHRLYEIALDLLGIPATLAPLEGFFSQASAVLDGRRYRLSAKNLEAELSLRINSRIGD